MASLKQQALETIESLPEDVDLIEIIERLLADRRLRRSAQQATSPPARRLSEMEGIGDVEEAGRDHDAFLYGTPAR